MTRWRASRWLGAACLFVAGCRRDAETAEAAPTDGYEELLVESQRVWGSLQTGGLIYIAVVIGAAATMVWLTSRSVEVMWRAGFDVGRRLGAIRTGMRALIVSLAALLVMRQLVSDTPLVGLGALALFAGVVAIALSGHIQSATIGLGLAVRRVIREGDRIDIGDQAGIVRRAGLTNIEIRRADGSTVLIPNKLLADRPLRIAQVRNTVPIVLTFDLAAEAQESVAESARRAAILLPLRASGTPVRSTLETDGGRRTLRLELEAISERAAEAMEAQLTALVADILERQRASPAPTG